MPGVDDDLSQLEKDIRALKIEYEQYFGGGRPRPPSDTIWRIEQMIKRYSEKGGQISFAQRFRFNNLAQTFAKYQEVFRKRMKQKEEGFVQRHYGATAKKLEEERAKAAPPPQPVAAGPTPAEARAAARAGEYTMAFAEPEREGEKIQELYKVLVEAKQKAGEKTDSLTMDSFRQFVKNKTDQLKKQKGAEQVEYAVSVEGGQVKLKARVKS